MNKKNIIAIVNGLKIENDYQLMALVFIKINLRDNCLSEVEFYLKDAFGIRI